MKQGMPVNITAGALQELPLAVLKQHTLLMVSIIKCIPLHQMAHFPFPQVQQMLIIL